MNNFNSNSMNNMNDDDLLLPPLFRSMNLVEPLPLTRETTVHNNKMTLHHNHQLPEPFVHNIPTALVAPTTETWAPMESLRKLSFYHPLEPNHVNLDRSILPQLLQGLKQAFHALSCQVNYATDCLTATALTMEGVEFQITLWANNRSNDDATTSAPTSKIICEMQRIQGDSYTYHSQYAQPIMKAVTKNDFSGFAQNNNNTSNNNNNRGGKVMDQLLTMMPPDATETTTDEDIAVAMECAEQMLLSDRYDACLLGMESLQHLTNPNVTGCRTATTVAQALVQQPSTVSKFLWTQLCHPDSDELQWHALKIWVQVWQQLAISSNSGRGNMIASNNNVMPTQDVVTLLLQMVERAGQAPHHATLALQGLTALCQLLDHNHDNNNNAVVRPCIAWEPVQYAHAVGQACHAALAQASGQLLAVYS